MRCPKCNATNDRVIDSREADNGTVIRRRRLCVCGHRWTTYEGLALEELDLTSEIALVDRMINAAQQLRNGLAERGK